MVNPIQLMQLLQTVKNSPNPQEAIFRLFGNNPQVRDVMELTRTNDPQVLLRRVCQEKGVDYEQLIMMVKSMGI